MTQTQKIVIGGVIVLIVTSITLFFISNTIRFLVSVPTGLFTESVVETSLYAIPFFILALWSGEQLSRRINDRYYSYAVNIILIGSVIALLVER